MEQNFHTMAFVDVSSRLDQWEYVNTYDASRNRSSSNTSLAGGVAGVGTKNNWTTFTVTPQPQLTPELDQLL